MTNGQWNDVYPGVYYQLCKTNGPGVGQLSTSGAISQGEWWWDGHPETGLYNHVMTPNLWSCDDSNNVWVNDGAAATAAAGTRVLSTWLCAMARFGLSSRR